MISEKRREQNRIKSRRSYYKDVARARLRAFEFRQRHKERLTKKQKLYRAETRQFIWKLKMNPCSDCKVSFSPVCMDFDHRPGEVKLFNIAAIGTRRIEKILNEIKKCDLVCANCHRIRTHKRFKVTEEVSESNESKGDKDA